MLAKIALGAMKASSGETEGLDFDFRKPLGSLTPSEWPA